MAFSSIEPWRRYRATERKANGRNPRFVKLRGLNPDRPVVCISTSYRFVSKVATEPTALSHDQLLDEIFLTIRDPSDTAYCPIGV
jgi:hypothetical protein